MRIPDNSTPAVVLRLESHGSLGIVRTLGRLGVPVYGIHRNADTPTLASRYCRGAFLWDIDREPAERSLEFLRSVAQKIGRRSLLIPTADEGALFLAERADELRRWFMFPESGAALVNALASKKQMYFLAQQHGVPTAETVFPDSRRDVLRFLETANFPVMLKGIDGNLLQRRTGKKMVIVRSAPELLENYDALEDPAAPNLMLQEYIPGGDDTIWMFNGYFNAASDCLVAFTGKKIRQNPVYTGMTSLGVCLPNHAVRDTTVRFMKAIGYRGILDIGYRYDARDGQYKVLDANPRCGATFRLFAGDNGLDVVRALYLDLTGQSVPHSAQRDGRKWWVEDTDLVSSYKYWKDGRLNWREWLASFRGIEESAYFCWDDPMPFFKMLARSTRKFWTWATEDRSAEPLPVRKHANAKVA